MEEDNCNTMRSTSSHSINPSERVSIVEADVSPLLNKIALTEAAAYKMYNEYANQIGFSIRRHNLRYLEEGTTRIFKGREFCCSKYGNKKCKGKKGKEYTNIDKRSGCKALIYFELDVNGHFVVQRHNMIHNHHFCAPDQSHKIRSIRKVEVDQLQQLLMYVRGGMPAIDAIKLMENEAGGAPFLGFSRRDGYNAIAKEKKMSLDGTDANTLIQLFIKRKENEPDFWFDFEVDEDNSLVALYWRDGKMKENYKSYGYKGVLGHDATYRTNTYGLICAPFVGINNHTQICMFGSGFIFNERAESYVWLYRTFLRSMDDVQPETIMIDQSFSMGSAIAEVFPNACHRLCTWHIIKNSKSNIQHLRDQPGFVDLFNHVLMYCDSIPEFNYFWDRLLLEYQCKDNPWLSNLHNLKDKWCPAYSKDFFSAGILSSQRSETTNRSVSKTLSKTASLCDFYHRFCGVVSEWRSKEDDVDQRCWDGYPELSVRDSSILMQAASKYTIDVYNLFDEQYMIGITCLQNLESVDDYCHIYSIWRPKFDLFRHRVTFDRRTQGVCCTCKKFKECGILCCHCLRVYNLHGVENIPDVYFIERWCKKVRECGRGGYDAGEGCEEVLSESATIWRTNFMRKAYKLACASDKNRKTREICDTLLESAVVDVEGEIGAVYLSDRNVQLSNACDSDLNILNPKSKRKKGTRNDRFKSISEKKSNKARTRRRIVKRYGNIVQNQQFESSGSGQGNTDVQENLEPRLFHDFL